MNELKTIIDDDFTGESMTFLQLVHKYSIVIPVIQRDYAQGRKTEKVTEVRQNFVRDLISYIKEASATHELDFIYGTVNATDSQIAEFVPLDGQQRLTTLFLLHLYVAGRKGKYSEFISIMKGINTSNRFTYKTRNSSTMFCERLLSEYDIEEKQGVGVKNRYFQTIIREGTRGWTKNWGSTHFIHFKRDPKPGMVL